MIVTLTANPSLDRTVELPGPLERGEVQRAVAVRQESGGKGVNVSRALAASGIPTLAVLPGDPQDPLLAGLDAAEVPYVALPIGASLRSNVTLTEPGGVTTKINEPGPELTAEVQAALIELLDEKSSNAHWVVLAGSLPPGVPMDFYAQTVRHIRSHGTAGHIPLIAVDSSGEPLAASIAAGPESAPDLLKPNAEELAELASLAGLENVGTAEELEADPRLAAQAAAAVVRLGVGAVLATLGAGGAVLVTTEGAWLATHPPITAVSTVGAGDSALAGYLLAASTGASPQDCLRQAVAHGSAAASLPGSTVPTLEQSHPESVTITDLNN
ncbi:1-phosphofructokinase family hexose kinase [Pseudarthrobacter sp. J1763]|uniref:1-phosphofructokinase family hexose kinase n=1 Tax=Pseudarthrobacter sp. J1763 TaxID=3420445 RepID=UPI003D2A9399